MKPEEQIKALAELDGWTYDKSDPKPHFWNAVDAEHPEDCVDWECMPKYLTSYDAIIPLIQKQNIETRRDTYRQLHKESWDIVTKPTEVRFSVDIGNFTSYTPSQLAEALLRATNKWK